MDRMPLASRLGSRTLHRVLDVGVLLLALGFLGPLVFLWSRRIFYPFDLEWMEGGMLAHAWRIRNGLSLYDAPVADFIPYVYPPGYAGLLAALSYVFPLDYPLARCASLLGSFAAALAIVYSGARQFRDPMTGLLGGILFLLCYGGSGAFYDLARVDGLSIGLLTWAVVLGAERRSRAHWASALLLVAVFFVKHSYALFGLPIAIGIFARDGWKRALSFSAIAAIPAFLGALWLNHRTHGGFVAYVLGVPMAHPLISHQAFPGSFGELALLLGIAWATSIVLIGRESYRLDRRLGLVCLGVSIIGAFSFMLFESRLVWPVGVGLLDDSIRYATLALVGASLGALVLVIGALRARNSWPWVYGLGVGFCALFITALMRGHQGGFTNVLMPAHWALVMGMTVTLARWRKTKPRVMPHILSALLWSLQLSWAFEHNDRERLSPKTEDVVMGDHIVAKIREHCQKPVLSPFAPWLPVRAGFAPSTQLVALWDIDHARGPRKFLVAEFDKALQDRHWGCIVDGGPPILGHGEESAYPLTIPLDVPPDVFFPSTGWRARPRVIRLPPH